MEPLTIPPAITRRVFRDNAASFERRLADLAAGKGVEGGIVETARMLGRMPDLLPHREALIDAIRSRQDPKTGLIRDQAEYECWPKPLAEVTSTLRVLGATLRHEVPALRELTDQARMREWLATRNWGHPWGGPTGAGHMIGGVLFAMSDLGMLTQAMANLVFDYIDSMRDDKYGVWAKGRFDPDNPSTAQLGGAFYFSLMYERFKRPLPHTEGACRMLMEMQDRAKVGTYNTNERLAWPFGSTDHDALCVLTRHARLNADLWREVLPSVRRYAAYFVEQMSREETYTPSYPTPQILAVLRSVFPDPDDDAPHWYYVMYQWNF
jgi:hypothetical protein